MRNSNPLSPRAARQHVKKVLAERARRAFSNVFNEVFPLAAAAQPQGSSVSYVRWYLQAMRSELDARESTSMGR